MASTTNSEDVWRPVILRIGFTDQKILVSNKNSKKLFHVHRDILTSKSLKFEEMFHYKEDEEENEKEGIKEIDDDPEMFELLLNHFYGKDQEFQSLASIKKLYMFGEKYEVIDIMEITKGYLNNLEMTENEFWDIVESEDRRNAVFVDKMWDYMKTNAESILKSEKIFNAPLDFITDLLQTEDLNTDEIDLLTAVTEWGYRYFKENQSENLIGLYQYIRFPTIRSDQFMVFTECYPGAIDKKSALEIFLYLHSTLYQYLPEWCSTNHVFRKNVFQMQRRKVDSLHEEVIDLKEG